MSPTRTSADRDVDLGAVAEDARGPRCEVDQPPDGVRGVGPGAGLEEPPEQDQGDDRGGRVEVEREGRSPIPRPAARKNAGNRIVATE